jgi:hypothetical protein
MKERFLLTRKEAAASLGMSLSHFQRHVQPYLRCVYSGQLRLYLPADLEAWTEKAATMPLRPRRREAEPGDGARAPARR